MSEFKGFCRRCGAPGRIISPRDTGRVDETGEVVIGPGELHAERVAMADDNTWTFRELPYALFCEMCDGEEEALAELYSDRPPWR